MLDGGWGIDALLGRQTRPHRDVDVMVRVSDGPEMLRVLERRGFAVQSGTPPHTFVLAHGCGLEVDVHAVDFDTEGNGVYGQENGRDWIVPAEGFGGRGIVAGSSVRCLSPRAQVLCHNNGYALTEKDFQDLELIQERFSVELPPRLRRDLR